ncbi:MAG: AMP-binding protein [Pirellulaceae bacterium]|nr:AMP-binding protein [Planctomycetales bacterium]
MVPNDWLSWRRAYTPQRIAIDCDWDGRSYTYAEMDDRALHTAAQLIADYDIQPGDRVACLSTNRLEYIDLYFACGKIGAVFVPLNHRLPSAAILEMLNDSQPSTFFYETALGAVAQAVKSTSVVRDVVAIESLGQMVGDASSVVGHRAQESETAMLLYTSGTTGRPKGAMISWGQIHWNAFNTILGLQMTEDDAAFLNMPLYHTGGWHVLFTPLMLLGGRVILQKKFDAGRCNERLGPGRISILFGVPTMLRMMSEAENFIEADFRRVRFAICGGEPCPLPLIEMYRQRGVAIRQGYGLTEAGPNCFSLPAEDAIRKQGSIGFPNFFVEARIADDHDVDVEHGQVGELMMRGPHVFSGYWRNEVETSQTLRDGWIATGDLMTRDEEGYYFVVGRKKDMYISGGENVYPAQVERVLEQHGSVAKAAVVGVPHTKWGEVGWAFVRRHSKHDLEAEELASWCRTQLAGYQCPERILFVPELPVGHSGKIDKLELRQRAIRMQREGDSP